MAVYFIRAGLDGDVKIGTSANPIKRLQGLQTGHAQKLFLIRLLDGGKPEERELHERFNDHRKYGEWFSFVPAMMADVGLMDIPDTTVRRRSPPPHDGSIRGRSRYAIYSAGGVNELARHLDVSPAAISVWTRVPAHHIPRIEALTGISGREMRPDIYPSPSEAA